MSDAAAWYDKPDWIGISATPHATIYIDSLLEASKDKFEMIVVDHDVPLKGRPAVRVKTINWPKAFYVSGLRPDGSVGARAMLLKMLARHQAPIGTEAKYYNTIGFFDHICQEQKLSKKKENG